jgi:hypothetical protein
LAHQTTRFVAVHFWKICENAKIPFGNPASEPGVDVMITIFCDFRTFSAKNWRFSQKPML